jgi:hypothetical protein
MDINGNLRWWSNELNAVKPDETEQKNNLLMIIQIINLPLSSSALFDKSRFSIWLRDNEWLKRVPKSLERIFIDLFVE